MGASRNPLLLLALVSSSCIGKPRTPRLAPPRTWVTGASEGAAFCLILNNEGTGRLVGAFERLNPLGWTYDSTRRALSLMIPRLDSSSVRQFQQAAGKGFLTFDTPAHIAVYDLGLGDDVKALWFNGYSLLPDFSLAPEASAGAPSVCNHGRPGEAGA